MKVYTSYFAKHKTIPLGVNNVAYVSIAVGKPRYGTPYPLSHCEPLKPYGIFGNDISDEEYIKKYRDKLDRLGVDAIRNAIKKAAGGCETVLLMCHEKNVDNCHRGDFAKWWYEKTGEKIEEWSEKSEKELDQIDLFAII